MRFKRYWRGLSLNTADIKVAPRLPRSWRLALQALGCVLLLTVGALLFVAGSRMTGFVPSAWRDERDALQTELARLQAERDALQANVDTVEARLTMERAAQSKLTEELKQAQNEIARLNEALSLNKVLSGKGSTDAISLRRLSFQNSPGNKLRYDVLVTKSDNPKSGEFSGELKFLIAIESNGKRSTVQYPPDNNSRALSVRFRQYQRVEGMLSLPAASKAKSVQVHVLERGKIKDQTEIAVNN